MGGGMGGMSMFEDDDMPGFSTGGSPFGKRFSSGMPRMSRTTSSGRRSSMPPRGDSSSGPQSNEISRPLKVSLEELYSGTVKHLKVGRRLLSGETEDKVLEITVHPGWKSGTKVKFPRAGNEMANGESQDLVFVVEEKPHSRFTRDGSDLITTVPIPLVDALTGTGGKRTVETLSGSKLSVDVPSGIVKPGMETKVANQGMPIRKDGMTKSKGSLIVKWDVIFPDRLTDSQKQGIRKVLSG